MTASQSPASSEGSGCFLQPTLETQEVGITHECLKITHSQLQRLTCHASSESSSSVLLDVHRDHKGYIRNGRRPQDGPLNFHTAPELSSEKVFFHGLQSL